MKGLHIISLGGNCTNKFEDNLIYWTQEVKKHFPKSVLLFDKNRLMVGETTNLEDDMRVYRVKLRRFTIEYICINGDMCIMKKVIRTDSEKKAEILYELPDRWSVTYLWYAY